ncbi:MAG: hypothetical protein DRJ26_02960 [Candidatus Methanomethylicota archaeon]|uniref:Uncharacterized protein n=1 Tax=Thermoproteota archaeon TaxID=2056631 RepID=A0A497F379_9CREN|nr:MAG: hypothetical protein DRJ26_02960 [Candidatus Verstraetearchaeota archaeon]
MITDPIPIITPDKVVTYIVSNWQLMIIYVASSILVEALLFKLALGNTKLWKLIAIANAVSSPLTWFFAIIVALPFTYTAIINGLNPLSLLDWKVASIMYLAVYFSIFTIFSSIIEMLFVSAAKMEYKNFTSTAIVANFVSTAITLLLAST